MSPDNSAIGAGWPEVLDEMEALARDATAGSVDVRAKSVWSPPTHLGPIPVELRERAGQVLAAHRDAIDDLQVLHRTAGRHLAAVRSVPSGQRTDQSVYLDVTG